MAICSMILMKGIDVTIITGMLAIAPKDEHNTYNFIWTQSVVRNPVNVTCKWVNMMWEHSDVLKSLGTNLNLPIHASPNSSW